MGRAPRKRRTRFKWLRRYHSGVYVVLGYHPDPKPWTPSEVVLYVGKSAQRPLEKRIRQHRYGSNEYGKPPATWSDLYTRHYWAYEGKCFPAGLGLREFWHIQWLRPVANDKMNRHNSRHIPIYEMRELRALRDQGVKPRRLVNRTRVEMGFRLRDGRVLERYGPGWKVR